MAPLSQILLAISAVWAVAALLVQAIAARSAIPEPRAAAAGRASSGVLYGFTVGMLPTRKESAKRYPVSFAAGILLHLGVLASFLTVLFSLFPVSPAIFSARLVLAPAACVGLVAGLFLLAKRLVTSELRAISPPDDYLASSMVAALLSGALAFWAGALSGNSLRILAAILLLYLPLGKLRHAAFFYLARADLYGRLGFRGVVPPRGGGDAGRA
jgi:hypothetical protein